LPAWFCSTEKAASQARRKKDGEEKGKGVENAGEDKEGEWRKGGYGERKKRREQKRSRWYSVNFAAYPLGYRPNDEP